MPQIMRMCVYGTEDETPVIGQDGTKPDKKSESL